MMGHASAKPLLMNSSLSGAGSYHATHGCNVTLLGERKSIAYRAMPGTPSSMQPVLPITSSVKFGRL